MSKHKKAALLLAAILAALIGIGFAVSPSIDRHRMDNQQAALLEHIETGGGAVKLPEQVVKAPVADYDEPEGEDVIPLAALPEPEQTAEAEPEVTAPETGEVAGIGILSIPCIDAKLPVTAGVTVEQLKVSEGWVTQTAPIGSEGNAVIAGHRSYTYGRHFNRLGELETGDEIRYATADGESMTFLVSEILTIEPGDPATFAAPPAGVAQLTLYTCTPIREATHRLLVRALRVEE